MKFCQTSSLLYKWFFMLVVKYVFSIVKQYALGLNMRKSDLPPKSFVFFTIRADVFNAVFSLTCK